MTEDTKTVLPKNPKSEYRVDGQVVSEWKLVLFSISKDMIIGTVDYFIALKKAEQYFLDTNENAVLVKNLSF